MNCKNCGNEIQENVKFCPFCGTGVEEAEANTAFTETAAENVNASMAGSYPGKGQGIAGMILGICSIIFAYSFYLGLAAGIVGLVLSLKSYGQTPNGMAKAGKVTSVIGIILSAVVLVLIILGVAAFSISGVAYSMVR